ncbi:MAG TPA: DUF1080 domain-containing protein [Gammaproteobacteria bacterium]
MATKGGGLSGRLRPEKALRESERAPASRIAAGLLALSAAVAAGGAGAQPVSLFDGTLGGWIVENGADVDVRDGVLRVAAPRGWLRSAGQYDDFRLRVEFRFVTDDADSGIFVRAVADGTFGRGWPSNSYQVQLRNPVGESRFPPVGGIFRHGRPSGDMRFDEALAERTSTGTGEWQTLEIDMVGESLTVKLNGVQLTEASDIVNPTGYIGIQAETGIVEFRAIEIAER